MMCKWIIVRIGDYSIEFFQDARGSEISIENKDGDEIYSPYSDPVKAAVALETLSGSKMSQEDIDKINEWKAKHEDKVLPKV